MSCHLNSLFQNYFIIFILYSSIELIVNHLNFLANCPYFRKLYLSTVHFMSHSNSETYVLYIIVTFWKKCFANISFNMYFVQTQCHPYCHIFKCIYLLTSFRNIYCGIIGINLFYLQLSSGIHSENCIEILCSLQYLPMLMWKHICISLIWYHNYFMSF